MGERGSIINLNQFLFLFFINVGNRIGSFAMALTVTSYLLPGVGIFELSLWEGVEEEEEEE